jgi:hypothetical protein
MCVFQPLKSLEQLRQPNANLIEQLTDSSTQFTPAYDLLCTRIHSPGEADMALMLFKDRFTEVYDAYGFYTYDDFLEFGKVLGIKESRVVKIIEEFNGKEESVDRLVEIIIK